jgi:putative ABC transport system substrate-binding protein
VRRREVITLLGGAAMSWPLAARAQQPTMPVIGVLSASSSSGRAHLVAAFRRGVREGGLIEGQSVAIEYRWAEEQHDRLPDLAADLARRQVAVIAAADTVAAIAVKAATTTVPVVFASGVDPVREGLVASLNRPGGNVTGITYLTSEVGAKQLGLLLELVPGAARIAALVDPGWPVTERFVADVRAAVASRRSRLMHCWSPAAF